MEGTVFITKKAGSTETRIGLIATYLKNQTASGVLSREEVEGILTDLVPPSETKKTFEELVREGYLESFQW